VFPLVLIPARLASTRLPRKPLADIHGAPMIVHVWRRAMEADVGEVVVAADDASIADAVVAAGGRAVLTRADHASGSDRIAEALARLDPDRRHDVIVNVQGDLPTIEPKAVRAAAALLADEAVAISTLATPIRRDEERDDPNVVKAIGTRLGERRLRALYFTRATAPWGPGELLHHIGLYGYRREALERFVALPPSPLELRERLEQLRALEAGMRIDIALVDVAPLGVDTTEDLARARLRLAPSGDPSGVLNWRRLGPALTTSGQPSEAQLAAIRDLGVTHVVNLGLHSHEKALPNEAASVAALGMSYIHIPVDFADPPQADFARFCEVMAALQGATVHVHCILNARVSAFLYRYRRDVLGVDAAEARAEMETVWRPGGAWARFVGDVARADEPHRYANRDYVP
jgi:3-deoxy-manno-octulosonate cytidylyltransferase (CMP-KDO synthetase)